MRQSNFKIRLTRLQQIAEELKPLHKDVEQLNNKIRTLNEEREKLTEEQSQHTIKSLPKDYKKFNTEQWLWVLSKGHDIGGMIHHNFQCAVLNKMGFDSYGFYPETNQVSINMSSWKNKPLAVIKEGFKILRKYLKPVTVVDYRHGTETGIRVDVYGLVEYTTSVVYVHEAGDVILYKTGYTNPIKFKSFNEFVDYLSKESVE